MQYGNVLLVALVGVIALQTCRAQIKFESLRVTACHTCEDARTNEECNTKPAPCANVNDVCRSVVWRYPSGKQSIYKHCAPPSFCARTGVSDCRFSTRHLQRCDYCCRGPLCNHEPVVTSKPKWEMNQ